jgi:hypothetical protein
LRIGKEAFTIGRDATPTLSSVVTRSDDIHIDSIRQAAKLGKDLSKSNKKCEESVVPTIMSYVWINYNSNLM